MSSIKAFFNLYSVLMQGVIKEVYGTILGN